MRTFLEHLVERGYKNRTIGIIENGSWAPMAAKTMKAILEPCRNLKFTEASVKIMSAMNDENKQQIDAMAEELCAEYEARNNETANKNDLTALFNIGYGLYVVTSNDGKKDGNPQSKALGVAGGGGVVGEGRTCSSTQRFILRT